jgi:hypothetical protein
MRNTLIAAAAAAALAIVSIPQTVAAKSGGWSGKGGGWSGKGGGGKSSGFHGKGHHKGGHKHARRFHGPSFSWGWSWPYYVGTRDTLIVEYPRQAEPDFGAPSRVAEPKIYTVGTDGGCRSEKVSVPQGTVTVYRC